MRGNNDTWHAYRYDKIRYNGRRNVAMTFGTETIVFPPLYVHEIKDRMVVMMDDDDILNRYDEGTLKYLESFKHPYICHNPENGMTLNIGITSRVNNDSCPDPDRYIISVKIVGMDYHKFDYAETLSDADEVVRAMVDAARTEYNNTREERAKAYKIEREEAAKVSDVSQAAHFSPMTTTFQVPVTGVIAEVIAERERQDAQHGGPPNDDARPVIQWLAMCRGYLGWATTKLISDSMTKTRAHVLQTAALCVALVESIDRRIAASATEHESDARFN